MSARAKLVNGVRHATRCCCPHCDPQNTALAKARAEAKARPRAVLLFSGSVTQSGGGDHARRPPLAPFETEKTRRFRELLRSGLSAARATEILEAELENLTP